MVERKPQRLNNHNYSNPKSYFVTINVISKELPLSIIFNEKVYLNCLGKIVKKCWKEIPEHFRICELGEYMIMPDHLHGIIKINSARGVGNRHACSDLAKIQNMKSRRYQILPLAIGSFKSAVSRSIHLAGYWEFKWQKSYYDRIIRMKELNRIRTYIRNNPLQKHEKE